MPTPRLLLIFYRWRWYLVEQLLRWGIYKQPEEGNLKLRLRKMALFLGMLL